MLYPSHFLKKLVRDDPGAWDYLTKHWYGARLLKQQGSFSMVFELPDCRVLKVTAEKDEIATAKLVMRLRPRGVVRVLEVGKSHYIMPMLVEGRKGLFPDAPGIEHEDCDPWAEMRYGRNIMLQDGLPVYIDMDGLKIDPNLVESECESQYVAC